MCSIHLPNSNLRTQCCYNVHRQKLLELQLPLSREVPWLFVCFLLLVRKSSVFPASQLKFHFPALVEKSCLVSSLANDPFKRKSLDAKCCRVIFHGFHTCTVESLAGGYWSVKLISERGRHEVVPWKVNLYFLVTSACSPCQCLKCESGSFDWSRHNIFRGESLAIPKIGVEFYQRSSYR